MITYHLSVSGTANMSDVPFYMKPNKWDRLEFYYHVIIIKLTYWFDESDWESLPYYIPNSDTMHIVNDILKKKTPKSKMLSHDDD